MFPACRPPKNGQGALIKWSRVGCHEVELGKLGRSKIQFFCFRMHRRCNVLKTGLVIEPKKLPVHG